MRALFPHIHVNLCLSAVLPICLRQCYTDVESCRICVLVQEMDRAKKEIAALTADVARHKKAATSLSADIDKQVMAS